MEYDNFISIMRAYLLRIEFAHTFQDSYVSKEWKEQIKLDKSCAFYE